MPTAATNNLTISTLLDLTAASAHAAVPANDGSGFDALLQAPPPPPAQENQHESRRTPQPANASPSTSDFERAPSDQAADESSTDSDLYSGIEDTDEQGPANSADRADESAEAGADAAAAAGNLIEQSLAAISLLPAVTANAPSADQPPDFAQAAAEVESIASAVEKSKRPLTSSRPAAVSEISDIAAAASGKPSAEPASTPSAQQRATPDSDHQTTAAVSSSTPQSDLVVPAPTIAKELDATSDASEEHLLTVADTSPAEVSATGKESSEGQAKGEQAVGESPRGNPGSEPVNQPSSSSTSPAVAPIAAPAATSDFRTLTSDREQSANIAATGPANRNRLPGQMLAQAAGPAPRRGAVDVDANRLLSRVARAFAAAQERDGDVRLRLSPPELGSLRLEIRIQDGAMVAHLETETEAARTAIMENLPALRERLAEQGVRVERFDVDLMQRQPTGTPNQSGGGQQDASEASQRLSMPVRRAAEATSPTPWPSYSITSADGLNVIV